MVISKERRKINMKIFIRSLTDYTNQLLCGKWIDISGCENGSEVKDLIDEYLVHRGKITGEVHEEFAIHDYINFPNLGEYPDFDEMNEVISLSHEYNVSPFVVKGFIDHGYDAKTFDDAFVGVYKSEEDFTEEYIREKYINSVYGELETDFGNLSEYLDWERISRDIFVNDFFSVECDDGIVVFARLRYKVMV
jgi:antirestriction protein